MSDIENDLQRLQTTAAPETLDRRVHATLRAHRDQRATRVVIHRSVWVAAAASLAAILVVAVTRREPPVPAPSSFCVVEAGPGFAAIFAPEPEPMDFFQRRKKQINRTETGR